MIKTAVLFFTVLLLCNCASSTPVQDPAAVNTAPEPMPDNASEVVAQAELADANVGAEQVAVDPENERYCTKEYRTGSRIPVKYCRTRAQDEANREHSKGWLEKVKRMPQQSIEMDSPG